jgi:predicted amidohydrolase YtcJ
MRLDALGFGNLMANDVKSPPSPKLSEATQQYIKLRGMGKAQKISRLSALRAMTIDAAWQVFEDSKRGSIENGKLADW